MKKVYSKIALFCAMLSIIQSLPAQITSNVKPLGFNLFCASQYSDICQGGSVILVAQGTTGGTAPYTFAWSSGGISPNQTGLSNSYVVGPFPASGTYPVNLTITDGFGGSTSSPIIYNVNVVSSSGLPGAHLSSNSPLSCLFDSLKIIANTGDQLDDIFYVEHNSFIANNYCPFSPVTQKVVQPDQYSNTFEVSSSDLGNTCKNYQVMNVIVNPSCNIPAQKIAGPITITQGNVPAPNYPAAIGLSGVVTISSGSSVSFTNKHFIIAPGSSIIVPNGATLIIDKSWLESCGCMWNGIQVQPGGSLTINNASIIEDAITAVEDLVSTTIITNISVKQTLFNRNDVAVYIHPTGALSTGPPTLNVALDNDIITCRNAIPHVPGNVATFNAIKNLFTNNYNNLDPFVLPHTTTKLGDRSNVGVRVGLFPAGVSTAITNSVFDYLNYGLLARQADFSVTGCQFSNMPGNAIQGNSKFGTLNGYGIGIYAASNDPVINKATVSGTNFYNLLRGIDILSYAKVNVSSNSFINQHTDALSSFNTAGQWYGQCGVQLTVGQNANNFVNPPFPIYNVEANNFLWFATAVHVARFYYNGLVTVTCNQIGDQSLSNSLNTYLWQGVLAEDVGFGSGSTSTNGYQIVYNNIIRALQNCIMVSGIKNGLYIYRNGTQHTNYSPLLHEVSLGALSTFVPQPNNTTAAIYAVDCSFGSVKCNELHGPGYLFTTKGPFGGGYGILIERSPKMQIVDNSLTRAGTNFGYGIDFRSACIPATFNNCQIHNCYYAYTLESSSIGPQGTMGSPVRFDWHPNHFITANFNSVDPNDPSTSSVLTLFNNNIPAPVKNFGITTFACGVLGRAYSVSGVCKGLKPSGSNVGGYQFCLFSPTPSNDPDECGPIIQIQPPSQSQFSQQEMDINFTDSITINLFGPERVFHNRRFLWERIAFDNLYGSASPMVQTFFSQNQNSGIGHLSLTEKALSNIDASTALSHNNFAPSNNMELKQQQVNAVKIKMADTSNNSVVTTGDISILQSIANGCPETDGRAFTEARTLLNILHGQQLLFTSNCSSGNAYRQSNSDQNIEIASTSIASIYPNPNVGEFTVSYSLDNENADAVFSLFNTNGEEVKKYTLKAEEKSLIIKEEGLPAGIYFYKINCQGKLLQNGRLAIVK